MAATIEQIPYSTQRLTAGFRVTHVEDWPWSSYRATAVGQLGPTWLTTTWVLGQFHRQLELARTAYCRFVAEGMGKPSPWRHVTGQVYLGSAAFVEAMLRRVPPDNREQIAQEALQPRRPTIEQVCLAVAKAAGVATAVVLDRRHRQDVFQVTVYLLRRVCNESLKATAARAGVSAARVSQIQRQIEEAGGLISAFPWTHRVKWASR